MSPTGFKYFVTFVDDFSRVTWLYLMKIRSELFSQFSAFCAEIETQFHVFVQTLRSDNVTGPTRLTDPNRVRGARLRTGTLYLI